MFNMNDFGINLVYVFNIIFDHFMLGFVIIEPAKCAPVFSRALDGTILSRDKSPIIC